MHRLLALALPLLALLAGTLVALPAAAASISLPEAEIEADFAGAGIEIDMELNEPQTLDRPDLLDVSSGAEVQELFDRDSGSVHTLNLFFIDSLAYCGGEHDPTLFGCGEIDGNAVLVESAAAGVGGGYGALLLAHEIGHAYGLVHDPDEENLMHPGVTGHPERSLNAQQRHEIRESPLTQEEGIGIGFGTLTTTINPIVLVPEPASGLLLAGGLAGLALRPRTWAA